MNVLKCQMVSLIAKFGIICVVSFVSYAGSGESHTAYFYKRTNSPAPLKARAGVSMLQVPARESTRPHVSEVVCSNYFRSGIELALGPVNELVQHVDEVSNKILNSGRPKRERKPRNLNL